MGDANRPGGGHPSSPPSSEEFARSYLGSPVAALGPAATLPRGGLGAICSPPGLGKTALLVHLGLDVLLRGGHVLQISLRDPVDRARAHWDELLRVIVPRIGGASSVPIRVERSRIIHSFAARTDPAAPGLDLSAVERSLELLREVSQFEPALLLVDGLDVASALAASAPLKELGQRFSLCTWMSVQTAAREEIVLPEADTIVWLASADRRLHIEVGSAKGPTVRLPVALDPASLLVFGEETPGTGAIHTGPTAKPQAKLDPRACTLYSGGALGAEAVFGEAAERFGLSEVNLTFDGHIQARTRGRYVLSQKELSMGDVSLTYVSRRLNRTYNDRGGLIRGVLQTLWHMVSRSQQVFVVGQIQEDGTVVGGTGWSVELARMWNRDLWVYDQDQNGWYRWDATGFTPGIPKITSTHICGTGTRYLNDEGRAAIQALFERSFQG